MFQLALHSRATLKSLKKQAACTIKFVFSHNHFWLMSKVSLLHSINMSQRQSPNQRQKTKSWSTIALLRRHTCHLEQEGHRPGSLPVSWECHRQRWWESSESSTSNPSNAWRYNSICSHLFFLCLLHLRWNSKPIIHIRMHHLRQKPSFCTKQHQ